MQFSQEKFYPFFSVLCCLYFLALLRSPSPSSTSQSQSTIHKPGRIKLQRLKFYSHCRAFLRNAWLLSIQARIEGRTLIKVKTGLLMTGNEVSERTCVTLAICGIYNWSIERSFSRGGLKISLNCSSPFRGKRYQLRRHNWRTIPFALNTGGISESGGQDNLDGDDSPVSGGTRLGRIVSAGGKQLLQKLNSARKNFPMKVFLLLLGFYTANALATILGQTGDWDVLVAGVVVAAIEGIGMLVYKKTVSLPSGRLQSFVVFMNYWKAGVCLGLFVDAFKLGS